MSVSFAPSTRFQRWMTGLRVSWMGIKAQAIMGAFAKVAGDLTYDWTLRAQLEHLPEYASPQSVGLIASERQLDAAPYENTAQLASRTTQATLIWRYAGTPLGMLLALHYAGFDGAVIVQQNGLAFQLQLPLPAIPVISGQAWQPQTSLLTTQTSQLAVALTSSVTPPTASSAGRSIPSGTSWWAFDSNTDCCSRFAIIFPTTLNYSFLFSEVAKVSFGSTDSGVATWSVAQPSSSYQVIVGPPIVTDGGGPVFVNADGTTKTTTGVTLRASAPFTGTVYASVFGAMSIIDQQRLKSVISKWKPAKATCMGVYVIQSGRMLGYPLTSKLGDGHILGASVSQIVGQF